MNKCQAVKDHDRKLFATISEQSAGTSTLSNKPHHKLMDQDSEDDSARFIGGARRKKKSQNIDSDETIRAGPPSLAQAGVGFNRSAVTVRSSNIYLTAR
jgi:hypothetical protein